MTSRESYMPGPTLDAHVNKEGETWTLVLTRELRHAPELVWEALTDPAQLTEWAPFDADRDLAAPGPVKLATIGAPQAPADCEVKRSERPKLLEHTWGGNSLRWELEPLGRGTRLTLWTVIPPKFIAWGAAGWQICLDVLDHLLSGTPIGRIVGPEAMKFDWPRLNEEYGEKLGVKTPEFKKEPHE